MSYMVEPNMQECADKITAALKEHNLMGAVFLSSPTRSGFIHEMSPPWSCITLNGDQLRIRSKLEEYPNQEAQVRTISETLSGVMGMIHNSQNVITTLKSLVAMVSHKIGITSIATDPRIQSVNPDDDQ